MNSFLMILKIVLISFRLADREKAFRNSLEGTKKRCDLFQKRVAENFVLRCDKQTATFCSMS